MLAFQIGYSEASVARPLLFPLATSIQQKEHTATDGEFAASERQDTSRTSAQSSEHSNRSGNRSVFFQSSRPAVIIVIELDFFATLSGPPIKHQQTVGQYMH